MLDVLFSVVVLGLVASFSPVIIATAATQLTRPSPVARALAVVVGVATATALLELMAFGLLAGLAALISGGNDRALRIGFNLGIGTLLIWLAARLLRGAPEPELLVLQAEAEKENTMRGRGLRRLFVLGFTLMFLNAKAFLLITGAVTQIRELDTWIEVVLLLVILYVVVNSLPTAPLIAYLISPALAAKIPEFVDWSMEQSKPVMDKARAAKRWLLVDHRTLVEVLMIASGLLLVVRGVDLWVG